MSKKQKIIAIVAILLVVLVSFFGGQTFSKYITEVSGHGNATIAKWNFLVNENEATTQTINLASTVNNSTLKENKIAPGTSGEFTIRVDATGSDVGVQYDLEIKNESPKPKNLQFVYKGVNYQTIEEIVRTTSGIIGASDENKVREITIKWEWPFEIGRSETEKNNNNKQDTLDSQIIENYTFDMTITGKQVEPNSQAA